MKALLLLSQKIDRFTEGVGRLTLWLTLIMVLMGSFNALARYAGRFTGSSLSSNAFIEAQWYLFSLVFLLGAAYTLKHGGHVRVDVLYGRLSGRPRAWINLIGHLIFLIPFCIFMLAVTIPAVSNSWAVMEQSPDPGGLARYPIKTMVPIAFVALLLQGISDAIHQLAILKGLEPDETVAQNEAVSEVH